MLHVKAHQLPVIADKNIVRWDIDDLSIYFNPKTEEWSGEYLGDYDDNGDQETFPVEPSEALYLAKAKKLIYAV